MHWIAAGNDGMLHRVKIVDPSFFNWPALSHALDLTEGQLPGHALRTAFIAMRVADAMQMSEGDRATLFYAAFLKDAGCSSNAALTSVPQAPGR